MRRSQMNSTQKQRAPEIATRMLRRLIDPPWKYVVAAISAATDRRYPSQGNTTMYATPMRSMPMTLGIGDRGLGIRGSGFVGSGFAGRLSDRAIKTIDSRASSAA